MVEPPSTQHEDRFILGNCLESFITFSHHNPLVTLSSDRMLSEARPSFGKMQEKISEGWLSCLHRIVPHPNNPQTQAVCATIKIKSYDTELRSKWRSLKMILGDNKTKNTHLWLISFFLTDSEIDWSWGLWLGKARFPISLVINLLAIFIS